MHFLEWPGPKFSQMSMPPCIWWAINCWSKCMQESCKACEIILWLYCWPLVTWLLTFSQWVSCRLVSSFSEVICSEENCYHRLMNNANCNVSAMFRWSTHKIVLVSPCLAVTVCTVALFQCYEHVCSLLQALQPPCPNHTIILRVVWQHKHGTALCLLQQSWRMHKTRPAMQRQQSHYIWFWLLYNL